MHNLRKTVVLALSIILTVSMFIIVGAEFASALPKPTAPEFTVRFVDNSYDVQPDYAKDPYTGKTIVAEAGYHVENKSIEVKIPNQPYAPKEADGKTLGLYYDIRWKGHFEDYWHSYNSSHQYFMDSTNLYDDKGYPIFNTPSVVATFAFNGDQIKQYGRNHVTILENASDGGQVDFQVQAFIGYYTTVEVTPAPNIVPWHSESTWFRFFTGEASGWSDTQTATIPDTSKETSPTSSASTPPIPPESVSPSQSPTTPMQPNTQTERPIGFDWEIIAFVILFVVVAVLVFVVAFQQRKLSQIGLQSANNTY